jgi:hypothetical protein
MWASVHIVVDVAERSIGDRVVTLRTGRANSWRHREEWAKSPFLLGKMVDAPGVATSYGRLRKFRETRVSGATC